jgi:hemolysin activation/secretion protein
MSPPLHATPMPARQASGGLRRFGRRAAFATAIATAIAMALLARAQGATGPTFEIVGFDVEGNTVLDAARIEAALTPYAGESRSFADVQAAAAALQAAYVRAGFGAVKVMLPEQRVDSGKVRLQVVEAVLGDVKIEGLVRADPQNIRRSLPALRSGTTPNTDKLAREISLANENPAKQTSVDLQSRGPNRIDAVISVQEDKPWKVGAVVDDTGTSATGRTRAGVFVQHANVADLDQVATLQYITSPQHPSDVTIAALNYRAPLPSLGDSIDLFGLYSNVNSGVVADVFDVRGSGSVVGLHYNQNLRPTASYQHRWIYGIEYRNVDNRVGAIGGTPDLVPDVTLHPASVGYAATWSGTDRQLDFTSTGVRNIPGGKNGSAADIAASRANANPNYAILRYTANLTQGLPAGALLRLALDGQYTRSALVSGEQFGIGGQDSVRGFDERALIDDWGDRVSFEFQSPNLVEGMGPEATARLLLFFDQGWLWRNHPLPGERLSARISSFGAGVRVSVAPSWRVRVDAANVVQGAGVQAPGDKRVDFSVGYVY